MATLAIYRGDQLERTLDLGEGPIRIGRAPENDLVLEGRDKGVSRAHAEIRYQRGRYVIVDLDSQNGVWFGDRRVKEEDLPAGVPVTIGPYRLVLEASPEAVTLPATDPLEPLTERDEVVSEPTQISRGTASSSRTELAPPPEAGARRRLPLAAMIGAGVLAVAVLAVAVTKFGRTDVRTESTVASATTPAPPPTTTTSIPAKPPEPTTEERFKQHYDKASELIAAGDFLGAKVENDLAMEILASDEGSKQREEISAKLTPATPPGSGNPATGQNAAPTKPLPGLSEFQMVVRRPREKPADFNFRQKVALDHLADARAAMAKQDYSRAVQLLEAALTQAGRPDFGRTRNEVRDLIQEAENARNAQQEAQRKAEAKGLVEEARKTAATDLPGAMRIAQRALKVDPDAAGLSELIKSIQVRGEAAGEAAFVRGKNLMSRGRNAEALRELDGAVQWLELVPGGHKNLDEARQFVQEMRKPK